MHDEDWGIWMETGDQPPSHRPLLTRCGAIGGLGYGSGFTVAYCAAPAPFWTLPVGIVLLALGVLSVLYLIWNGDNDA